MLLQLQRLKKRKPLLAGAWQHTMAKLGLSSRGADAISFLALFLAIGLAFSAVLAFSGSDEDDLVLRARQQTGNLVLSVYAGDELIAGANDISVLVQDATGSPLLDAQVEVSATREGAAPNEASETRGHESDADNKLLNSATIDLPVAGAWLVRVNAQGASLTFPIDAVVHKPGLDDWWPYLVFPAFALLLLVVYLRRARQRQPVVRERVTHATAAS